jgi:pSer/pThr/pTyr-binding forkhead associated (FHA) protein
MPLGESFVGRAVDCQLRFNDAAVSRRHIRVICTKDGVFVENLSLTNGTRVNGRAIMDQHRLSAGDRIEVGHRVIDVVMETGSDADVAQGLTGFEEEGYSLHRFRESDRESAARELGPAGFLASMQVPDSRNCPKCRASVQNEEESCPSCGYQWPRGGPATATKETVVPREFRRAALRRFIRVPVIYSSECLTLEATARDLSQGGMFIASEILDPVGTICEITALPDGRSALHFEAVVCHVSTEMVNGRPPGFGVEFSQVSGEAEEWLSTVSAEPHSTPGA